METEQVRVISVERRLKLSERACPQCGRTFLGWGKQRFDTPACQKKWDYYAHIEARRAARRARYWHEKGG